jgi:hypothetical protein
VRDVPAIAVGHLFGRPRFDERAGQQRAGFRFVFAHTDGVSCFPVSLTGRQRRDRIHLAVIGTVTVGDDDCGL